MSIDASPLSRRLWLAPLTRGGHLAFRRLCVEMGAEITVGEMIVVKRLLSNDPSEFARLKSHPEEPFFGVQLADRNRERLVEAARLAESRGARFIDLNCGCPIEQMTRRGLGASLLRKPARLGRLVAAVRDAAGVPVTVKLRLGWREGEQNVSEVARVCEEAGASALTIHGRTREQRYSRAANWDAIGRVAAERTLNVVGNGDILSPFEATERETRSGVRSIMVGRGALIKPWIFRELRSGQPWLPSADERFGVYWRLVELMREHFGADERGRRRTLYFLPWHFGFFCRYRPIPDTPEMRARSLEHPLLQSRLPLGPQHGALDRLLADARPETHTALAESLLESASRDEAHARALTLAAALPPTTATEAEPELVTEG